MTDVILDASVVAKWYIPERDHRRARALRDAYLEGRHDPGAPALLPFEVINALRHSGQYEGERLDAAATTLPEYGIDLIRFRDCGPVAGVADALDVTVSDAAYLALAESEAATLYTADSSLLEAIAGSEFADLAVHVGEYGT